MMIEKSANKLRSSYLTLLEVGGAYTHRFEGLLSFLRIPYSDAQTERALAQMDRQ